MISFTEDVQPVKPIDNENTILVARDRAEEVGQSHWE